MAAGSIQDSYMQTDDVFVIPTKTESRSSETQRRMYSRTGPGYVLATKDTVSMAIEVLYQLDHFSLLAKLSSHTGWTQHMRDNNMDSSFLGRRSSFPGAA